MNTRKNAIAQLRLWVIEGAKAGGWKQRCRLLAYGFLRGLPYEVMERTANEDKHCSTGRTTFYTGLALDIAKYICRAYDIEFSVSGPEWKEVRDWLFVRINRISKEAA